MRAVITVIGKDNVGILHQVSGVCAKYQANSERFAGYVCHDHDGGHYGNDNRFHTAE